jgi:hypothetical protein
MENVGIYFGHLEYIPAIRYILWLIVNLLRQFGIFFPVLVYCVKKNLATLAGSRMEPSIKAKKPMAPFGPQTRRPFFRKPF